MLTAVCALVLSLSGSAFAQRAGEATGGTFAQDLWIQEIIGKARTVSTSWGDAAAVGANFNFGNPATTGTSKLPQQTQDAISVGKAEAYDLALWAIAIF
jgi:hypothetical protein